MNGFTHKQAQKYLRLELDGLLTDEQRRDLETHLSGCEACRADAQAFSQLTSRLQSGFRSRWDAQDGPSQNVMARVRSQTRRIIMSNRINVAFKLLGGIAAVLVFGFLINRVVSQMRDYSVAAKVTEIPDNVAPVSAVQADGQWIAFQMEKDGNMDIYAIRADGSSLTDLTNDPGFDGSLVWSPDGTRLAFVSDRDGNENIYVMNMDGSDLTRITDDPVSDAAPLWSPDGTKIAYQSRDINANMANVFIVDSNGENRHQLTNDVPGVAVPEAWSLDGQFLFFIMDQQIVKVNADTGDVNPITSAGEIPGHFALSTDGTEIFYLVGCGQSSAEFCVRIKIIRMDNMDEVSDSSMEIQQVCSSPDADSGQTYMPKWSPDRTKILFAFHCKENGGAFYIANADGSDFKPLTTYPIPGSGRGFDWSADSHSVVFTSSLDGEGESLYILHVDDVVQNPELRPTRLDPAVTNPFFPAWQPTLTSEITEQKPVTQTDRRLLAFSSASENGNIDIFTMYPDGSDLNNLTDSPAHDVNPYWSPDGRRIAFMSDRDGFMNLYVMNADGSGLTQVTNNDQSTAKAHHEFGASEYGPWSPDGSKLLFTEWSPDNDIWKVFTIGADGQNKTPIAEGPGIYAFPSWSPDGQHIAFVQGDPLNSSQNPNAGHLYVVDANGDNLTEITKELPVDESLDGYFSDTYYWSQDGRSIFFIASNFNYTLQNGLDLYHWKVYEASLDGTLTLRATTRSPIGGWWDGVYFITQIMGPGNWTWVYPDGSFHSINPTKYCEHERLYDPNTQGYTSAVGNFRQSPNGDGLITATCPDGEVVVSWVNSTGTEFMPIARLTTAPRTGYLENASWSQGDRFVAFRLTSDGKTEMYIVNIAEAIKDPFAQPVTISIVAEGVPPDVAGGAQTSNISWQPIP